MPALRHHLPVSVDDYLAAEIASPIRHEFVDGEVFAMTGATLRHNSIVGNLLAALRAHLRGSPCRVFFEAVKLHVARDNAFYYPDLMVSCSERVQALGADDYVVSDPVLVIEVLSPATEHIDRREKLLSYRKLPSLREYLLVPQDGAGITLYRRSSALNWDEIVFTRGEAIELVSVGLELPFEVLFEDIPLA